MNHDLDYIVITCDTLLSYDMPHHHREILNYYELQKSMTLLTN
jgi:hypothetical protein